MLSKLVAIKKLLCSGIRGKGNIIQDLSRCNWKSNANSKGGSKMRTIQFIVATFISASVFINIGIWTALALILFLLMCDHLYYGGNEW